MQASARWGWLVCLQAVMALNAHAADGEASDTARRDQVNADRAAAQARYDQTVRECERGFVVTACVNQAKAERRAALDRAAREQAALDDAQRKRRAEERRQRIAQKQAQQTQQVQQAQQATSARHAASAPPAQVRTPRLPASAASAAKPARRPEPRSSQAAAAVDAEAAERATQSQERRDHAQSHEEAVRKRNAERDALRSPAAPLPVPAASAAASAIK